MRITYLDNRPDEVVEEEHFVVVLNGEDNDWESQESWIMTIDLTGMCSDAGRKVTEEFKDGSKITYVLLPITRFRKCLKLICKYADDRIINKVQKYLDDHFPRWGTEFRKLR